MKITTLFVDIGGVLLTNGWDHNSRQAAAKKFKLDFKEMEDRHRLMFDTCELGKLNLQDYLAYVIFFQKRKFTSAQFRQFMFAQSQPLPETINLIFQIKNKYNLKTVALSNEVKELNNYRIKKFKLTQFLDFFICSCFVHCRKPDPAIFQLALDTAQTSPQQIIYIDDREVFVEIAAKLGINSIHHTSYQSTSRQLQQYGLNCD